MEKKIYKLERKCNKTEGHPTRGPMYREKKVIKLKNSSGNKVHSRSYLSHIVADLVLLI